MPNTISSPNTIDLNTTDVWQYPAGANIIDDDTIIDDNPAAEARAEYLQHQYAEGLATSDLVETQPAVAVNEYETVPAQGELTGYATNEGRAIDPAHTEAVLAEAATAVNNAYNPGPTPEMLAAAAARESQERLRTAIGRANVYAPRLEAMRDHALVEWGTQDPSLN